MRDCNIYSKLDNGSEFKEKIEMIKLRVFPCM